MNTRPANGSGWLAAVVFAAGLAVATLASGAGLSVADGPAGEGSVAARGFGVQRDGGFALSALPFELEPGDVLANRPVGVLRESESSIERRNWSAQLGVLRESSPREPVERMTVSRVLGVHRGAAISSLAPQRVTVDVSDQTLTVNGFGLQEVALATIEPADGISVSGLAVDGTGDSVIFTLDVDASADTGLRRVRLFNSDGDLIPKVTPDADQLLVSASQPVIHSVEPILLPRGSVRELVIRGENLRGLPYQAQRLDDPEPSVRIVPAEGVALGKEVSSNPEGTLVTTRVSVSSGAPLGDRLVQVETRSAVSSDMPSSANTVSIVEDPLREFSPLASVPLGVTREKFEQAFQPLFSRPLVVSRGPSILSFSPEAVLRGESAMLTFEGVELGTVTSVSAVPGEGITLDNAALSVSGETIEIPITVAERASLFERRLVLPTPDGELVAPDLLQIQDAPPEVHALTPTFIVRDGAARTLHLQGDHFSQAQGAVVLPDDDIVVQDFSVTGDDTATLTLLADPGAGLGGRVVQVLGVNEDSASAAEPNNMLYVIDVAQIFAPVASAPVGVTRLAEGQVEPRPLFSRAVGVTRGHYAGSLEPGIVPRGTGTTMTIEGKGLDAVTEVLIESGDGIIPGDYEVLEDGGRLRFDITVAVDAPAELRRVILKTQSGRVSFVPPRAAVFEIADNDPDAPETVPDSYDVFANGAILVDAEDGLLANDSSTQGELFAVLRTLPANGALSLDSDGSFSYTPDPDFAGVDQFEYSAGNDQAVGNAATVSLTVEERNDAVSDQYATPDDASVVVDGAAGLLANDRIEPGDSPTIVIETAPQLGEFSVQPDGGFQYTPDGTAGVDTFSYRLDSPEGISLPAEVTIEIVPVNDPPVASDDAYVVTVDEQLQVAASAGVLRNDSDPDGDSLSVQLVSNPAEGSLALQSGGGFTYTPPDGYVGRVQFVYEVFDGSGLSDTATVTITVNNALAPHADFYELDEGEVLVVPPEEGVLVNDSVISQGEAVVVLDETPMEGTVDLLEDGSFSYDPDSSDFSGTDQFTYYLEDDAVTSVSVAVTLNINPVNDPPLAEDDEFLTDENAELVIEPPGFLENDSDVDSSGFTASLSVDVSHGTIQVEPDGGFTYVPEINYRGEDSFVYSLEDDNGASTTGTVTINVTQPPTATNDVYFVETDDVIEVTDPEAGLLVNDHDAPENDELSTILSESPEHGVAVLNDDGTFAYAPDAGFQGIDTMTYRVTDGRSESNVATVTFPVGITSFPKAVPDHYVLAEEEEFFVPAEEGLLVNDTDADTPLSQLEADLVGRAYRGRRPLDVTVNDDGSFTVTPWDDFFGETFFVYQVFDGTDISNAAIVTLEVMPVNDGVEAVDDEFGVLTNEVFESNSSGSRSIGFNDSYDDDYEVEWEIVSLPQNGSVEMNRENSVFRYTPDPDYAGTDQFTYRAYQVETGISDTAIVTMYTNAPPIAQDDFIEFDEDIVTEMLPPPIANDSDPDGDVIRYRGDNFYDRQVPVRMNSQAADAAVTLHPRSNFYGPNTSDYSITDGSAWVSADIEMVVHPVPDSPVAADDEYLVQRNELLVINDPGSGVLGNDFDPDKRASPHHPVWEAASGVDLEPLTAELVSDVEHGSLTFYDNGVFIYEPARDYSGFDTFTYRALDATGRLSEVESVQIRVNSPAIAVDDAYVVNEDLVLEQGVEGGLLANDSDPDGDDLWASRHYSGCAPCNGHVDIDQDGSFRYTPDRDFHGQDEFFYRVRDRVEGFDVGRVVVTVLPINDAPITEEDTYRTQEDVVLNAPEPQGVLRNDVEVDGDGLADAELVDSAANGSVAFQPDGSFTYTPGVDFNGRDTFSYRVFDTTGLVSGNELVEVFVTPVNDPPIAADDQYQTDQESVLEVGSDSGVMANDSDVDGPALIVVLVSPPQHGQVALDADGAFVYEPDGVFMGTDHFGYQVDDGLGAVDSATVSVVVNAVEPEVDVVANDDFYQFEGPSTSVAEPGVVANDVLEGDGSLTASLVVAPEEGVVSLEPDGSFHYQAPPGYAGIDGFTYSASTGGVSDLARVTLDILPAGNVPPIANDDDYSILEDRSLDTQRLGSLLANDEDHEGDPLTLEVLSQPASGQLEMREDGHFHYTPVTDFNGSVSFSYRVSDGQAVSGEATVTIAVISRNDAPEALDDAYQTVMDQVLEVPAEAGLLANDSDVDGDELTVTLVDSPDNGQVDVESDGAFSYTPLPGFSGSDVFRYVASDTHAQVAASVFITVTGEENRPPSATGENYTVAEDELLDSQVSGSVLDNDSDPDGDTLIAVLEDSPEHGHLDFEGGEFTYRPDADFHGADSFTYHVSDGEYSDGPVAAQIEVTAVNDEPVTRNDLYTTTQGQALVVPSPQGVLVNDSDADGDVLTVQVHVAPAQGQLALNEDGGFEYVPDPGFSGRDEFAYLASDGTVDRAGRAIIDVTEAPNQRPVAAGEIYEVAEDTVLDTRSTHSLLANDVDPDGSALTLEPESMPSMGDTEVLSGGHIIYTPARDAVGDFELIYRVSDGTLESEAVAAVIRLQPQNDPPDAQHDVYAMWPEAVELSVEAAAGVLINDLDVDGDTLVPTIESGPQHGQVSLGLDGSFTYIPTSEPRRDSFTYSVADSSGLTSSASVTLIVSEGGDASVIFSDQFEGSDP